MLVLTERGGTSCNELCPSSHSFRENTHSAAFMGAHCVVLRVY